MQAEKIIVLCLIRLNQSACFQESEYLTPECEFIAKEGTYDLKGKISFEEQALLGEHVTGRTYSYSIPDEQVVRSSVPIQVNGETVGIIYGIIKIETINEKYNNMAKELDATTDSLTVALNRVAYKKVNGETVILSVYKLNGDKENSKETLWVFARD